MAWSKQADRYRGVPRDVAHRIRVRDSYTCQACGAQGHEVDHKVNVKAGGTDDDHNLHTLCTPCHKAKTAGESRRARAAKRSRLTLPTQRHPGLR